MPSKTEDKLPDGGAGLAAGPCADDQDHVIKGVPGESQLCVPPDVSTCPCPPLPQPPWLHWHTVGGL